MTVNDMQPTSDIIPFHLCQDWPLAKFSQAFAIALAYLAFVLFGTVSSEAGVVGATRLVKCRVCKLHAKATPPPPSLSLSYTPHTH